MSPPGAVSCRPIRPLGTHSVSGGSRSPPTTWLPAVYMSYMSQNFGLFHYRIYPFEAFEFFCSCIRGHRLTGRLSAAGRWGDAHSRPLTITMQHVCSVYTSKHREKMNEWIKLSKINQETGQVTNVRRSNKLASVTYELMSPEDGSGTSRTMLPHIFSLNSPEQVRSGDQLRLTNPTEPTGQNGPHRATLHRGGTSSCWTGSTEPAVPLLWRSQFQPGNWPGTSRSI